VNQALCTVLKHRREHLHISQMVFLAINVAHLSSSTAFFHLFACRLLPADLVEADIAALANSVAITGSTGSHTRRLKNATGGEAKSESKYSESKASPSSKARTAAALATSSSEIKLACIKAAQSAFEQTGIACVDMMRELIEDRVDSLLVEQRDWMPSKPNANLGASDSIEDIVQFLDVTFMCMHNLPVNTREMLHYTLCNFLCKHLIASLMDASVKKINIIGLFNLRQDVKVLDAFANRCNVPGLSDAFSQVRQICEFFFCGDPMLYFNEEIRAVSFAHLSPQRLFALCNKFQDLGMFNNKAPKGIAKVKRKQLLAVAKKLKPMM
jgi:hypothetical protein